MNKGSDRSSSDYNRNELASSDQLLILHEQINQSLSERSTLIKSRDRIIKIAIASWLVTLFALFVLPELEESRNTQLENNIKARQMAAQQIKTTALNCLPNKTVIPTEVSASSNEAEAYMQKVRLLLGKTNKDKTSSHIKSLAVNDSVLTKNTWAYHNDSSANYNPALKKEISEFVYKWATIWELQDITAYFQLYSSQFEPGYQFNNLDEWKKSRGYYTKKHAWIKIQIDDLKLIKFTDSTVTVTFNQSYRTPTYFDQTLKKLKLALEDGEWRIQQESGVTQHVNLNPKQ